MTPVFPTTLKKKKKQKKLNIAFNVCTFRLWVYRLTRCLLITVVGLFQDGFLQTKRINSIRLSKKKKCFKWFRWLRILYNTLLPTTVTDLGGGGAEHAAATPPPLGFLISILQTFTRLKTRCRFVRYTNKFNLFQRYVSPQSVIIKWHAT